MQQWKRATGAICLRAACNLESGRQVEAKRARILFVHVHSQRSHSFAGVRKQAPPAALAEVLGSNEQGFDGMPVQRNESGQRACVLQGPDFQFSEHLVLDYGHQGIDVGS